MRADVKIDSKDYKLPSPHDLLESVIRRAQEDVRPYMQAIANWATKMQDDGINEPLEFTRPGNVPCDQVITLINRFINTSRDHPMRTRPSWAQDIKTPIDISMDGYHMRFSQTSSPPLTHTMKVRLFTPSFCASHFG